MRVRQYQKECFPPQLKKSFSLQDNLLKYDSSNSSGDENISTSNKETEDTTHIMKEKPVINLVHHSSEPIYSIMQDEV